MRSFAIVALAAAGANAAAYYVESSSAEAYPAVSTPAAEYYPAESTPAYPAYPVESSKALSTLPSTARPQPTPPPRSSTA